MHSWVKESQYGAASNQTMPEFLDWEENVLTRNRVARMATVDEKGNPHVVPVVYACDGKRIFTPIDEKPKKDPAKKLRRIKNIENNKAVNLLVDEYSDDWSELLWVQLRGRADILYKGKIYENGIKLLKSKYHQYAEMKIEENPLIVIYPVKIVSWRAQE